MSVLCQQETHAPQQTTALFDHLVGASEECGRDIEAERFGGLEVHHQFELGRLFDRQVGGLRTLIGRTGTGNSM